ncbi:hypothetical protein HWV62_41497 [Athelia sp. TMB]|nr:hypothetical protein HWV62_41497 [Athelia sp. TMB]
MSTVIVQIPSVAAALFEFAAKNLYVRRLHKRIHLLSLPLELLEEVVKNLDWLELIRIRMTCKTFHQLSKSRNIRVQLVKRAQACDPHHTPLDRAIERYTADKLEDWAMRRLTQTENGLPNFKRESVGQRNFYLDLGVEHSVLLPGGRWLVSSLKLGGLVVTDLDSSEVHHQTIWESREDVDEWPAISLVYSVDEEATNLTFDLALDRWDPSSEISDRLVKLYFWRVSLSEDGTTFIAQFLNSFWTSGQYLGVSTTLKEDYFARIARSRRGHHCVEIFHWRKSTSDMHYKSSFRAKSASASLWTCVRLLPESRVLIVTDDSLSIYHLPEMAYTDDISVEEDPLQIPIHTFPLGGKMRVGGMSRLITDSQETRLVVLNGTGIYEFVIPHARDLAPTAFLRVTLKQEPRDAQAFLGLHKAILRFRDGYALPIGYSCRNPLQDPLLVEDTPSMRFKIPGDFMPYRPPIMDEGVGRLTYLQRNGNIIVIDFGKYSRHGA